MPKWEYLFVEVNMVNELSDTFLNNWLVHRVNGVELKDWKKGVHFYTYFNQLGEQGWELFMREQTLYIFKRQKNQND